VEAEKNILTLLFDWIIIIMLNQEVEN